MDHPPGKIPAFQIYHCLIPAFQICHYLRHCIALCQALQNLHPHGICVAHQSHDRCLQGQAMHQAQQKLFQAGELSLLRSQT